MKKYIPVTIIVYLFFAVSGSLFGLGEKTLLIGAEAAWDMVNTRSGVAEVPALRPYPVLALSSARAGTEPPPGETAADLALSFDEGQPERFADSAGHYTVSANPGVSGVDHRWARAGAGAALFSGGSLVLSPRGEEGLLSGNRNIEDFSLEFWLYPGNMETGEQILSWSSSRQDTQGNPVFQRIQCAALRNRLRWTFSDFFAAPGGDRRLSFSMDGFSPISPQTWSHHLIRFDAATGLFEYLVDGVVEAVVYTTPSGGEDPEVYTPMTGRGGALVLGSRYAGLIDEFRIHGSFVEAPELRNYPPRGGRAETRLLDLGPDYGSILRVEVSGGRASASGGKVENEFAPAGGLRFPDDSALQFFIRTADVPGVSDEAEWVPFEPGRDIPFNLRGRFVQLAVVFYPSGDGETSPYLESLRIIHQTREPPPPPSGVTAIARDGAVDLSWRASAGADTEGYLVYYGTAGGNYFGTDAILGSSPINAGKRRSIRIDGLTNGVLYYFSVAAYDRLNPPHGGDLSREVTARPLRTFD
jgi:hypothetical protein